MTIIFLLLSNLTEEEVKWPEEQELGSLTSFSGYLEKEKRTEIPKQLGLTSIKSSSPIMNWILWLSFIRLLDYVYLYLFILLEGNHTHTSWSCWVMGHCHQDRTWSLQFWCLVVVTPDGSVCPQDRVHGNMCLTLPGAQQIIHHYHYYHNSIPHGQNLSLSFYASWSVSISRCIKKDARRAVDWDKPWTLIKLRS